MVMDGDKVVVDICIIVSARAWFITSTESILFGYGIRGFGIPRKKNSKKKEKKKKQKR